MKKTKAIAASLKRLEWFSCVGDPAGDDVERVANWAAAVKSCTTTRWGNTCLKALNVLRANIYGRSPKRMDRWNDTCDKVDKIIIPLVEKKIAGTIEQHPLLGIPVKGDRGGFPVTFQHRVFLDISSACIEAEHEDLEVPSFYGMLLDWYKAGRFPCGWQGKYPDGKLVIY